MGDKTVDTCHSCCQWLFKNMGIFQLKFHRTAKTLSPHRLCKRALIKVGWLNIQVRLEQHNKSVTKFVPVIVIDQR